MLTPTVLILVVLIGCALLFVLIMLLRYFTRRAPSTSRSSVNRSVVYLVSDAQLLVMQQATTGRLRARLELPKGKAMRGETDLEAAYRECLEESGLRPTDLQLLTSFQTPVRSGKKRGMETWNAFWGNVPADTLIPFTHRVKGKGRDRGRVYHFQLVLLDTVELHPPLDVPLPALRRARAEGATVPFSGIPPKHGGAKPSS